MSNQTGQESRIKKTLINARINLIFYFLTLALSFFSRKIFLNSLGADFVGLTGTLQNLLGFLNLAELGVGTAIGYVLYKPLYEHNQNKINEIISVMGYLYRKIGIVILGAGCVLACFLPLIFPAGDTGFSYSLIYFAYFAFLVPSLIGYFINYRQNLLGADQRNYVVTICFQSTTIFKMLVQMTSAYYTGNYYLWIAIELIFGIVYSFILNWKINRVYPWLHTEIRLGRLLFKKYPEVMRYTKQLFVHQINSFIQFQTTPFLTYAFTSLQIVAYYGNYTLIVDKLTILMNSFLGSTNASVGNLIAEGNDRRVIDIFWELTTIRFFFAGIIFCIMYFVMEPLISLWVGPNYVMNRIILVLLLLKVYIQIVTGCIGQFLYGYGLFADVWASVVQSIVFFAVAITGGCLYGLPGIILASIISIFVIMGVWKPYYLYTKGFKQPISNYWLSWIGINIINVAAFAMTFVIVSKLSAIFVLNNFINLILHAIIIVCVYIIISCLLYAVFTKSSKRVFWKVIRR